MPSTKSQQLAKTLRFSRRHRTPTVLQMEAVECGAAALGIILAHHGRIVALEELRLASGVSRDGSKASNVIKAALGYGLIAKGFSKEPEDLPSVQLPCIVFWNFNHFLVVEGFGRHVVYLNDPAAGPREVTYQEFDQSFTGVVLTFEPGPDFKKGGHKRSLIRALRSRLAGSETGLLCVTLAGLGLVVPGLIIPTFAQVFVDQVLIQGRKQWMGPLLIGMAVTAIFRAALGWFQGFYLMRLQAKMAISTSSRFFWHVLRLPIEFFTQRYGGEIGSRVQINDGVAHLLSGQLAGNFIDLLMAVFYVIVMIHYDVFLTVVGVSVAVCNIFAVRHFARRRVDGSRRLQQEEGKLTGTSMNGLQMIETLKATGTEPEFFVRWSGYQSKVVNIQQKMALYGRYLDSVSNVLSAINTATIIAVGGLRVMDGYLSIGELVAFQSLMASFSGPFNGLVNMGATLQDVQGSMNRLDDVLWHRQDPQLAGPETAPAPNGAPVKLTGELVLRGLTFGYSKLDPPLIEDFSLTIKPGQRVAIVGASGSGKSTVAKLVCGLYESWSGEILFDGKMRNAYPRGVLTNSLALVDQDVFLFEGTVSENLTLWDEEVPDNQVVQAAKDACIHDDVVARPNGYGSKVSEGGANFSGGQRQRLEIARALVNYPSVLVLDEATSALDPTTEKLIDDNLRRRGCTCLIVAHRLSTIRDCDEIIVMERGRVVQRGTHEALKAVEGAYSQLIKAE
jgi:NHLM bacteriocin system ABC transporter peptidase/ATP-binding protein